jgi:hypothetical protein
MADADEITAVGRNKKIIKVGDAVKYVNSDTLSRVTEIKKDEQGKVWALLESTNLGIETRPWNYRSQAHRKERTKRILLPKNSKKGSGKKGNNSGLRSWKSRRRRAGG